MFVRTTTLVLVKDAKFDYLFLDLSSGERIKYAMTVVGLVASCVPVACFF